MARRYAEETRVPVAKSKADIERLLGAYGADQFMSGWDDEKAMIAFRIEGRMIRLTLPVPPYEDYTETPSGMARAETVANRMWEQAQRQSWRALLLVIRAKLEAVEAGITTMDAEFLAHIIMPDNQTVADHIMPRIEESYATGKMPPLLPAVAGES